MKFSMKKELGFTTQLPYGELHIAGDDEYGFRPFQLLVSSIAVCSGGVLRKILQKQRIEVEDISIEANVQRNEEQANRVEKIELHFIIKGKGLKEEKMHRVMELTRKNCAMVQSVTPAIEVVETFELITE